MIAIVMLAIIIFIGLIIIWFSNRDDKDYL